MKKVAKSLVLAGVLLVGSLAGNTNEAKAWNDIIYKDSTETYSFNAKGTTKTITSKTYTMKPKKAFIELEYFANVVAKKGSKPYLKVQLYKEEGKTDKLIGSKTLTEKQLESTADISPRTSSFKIVKKGKYYAKYTYNFTNKEKRTATYLYN